VNAEVLKTRRFSAVSPPSAKEGKAGTRQARQARAWHGLARQGKAGFKERGGYIGRLVRFKGVIYYLHDYRPSGPDPFDDPRIVKFGFGMLQDGSLDVVKDAADLRRR
jgi:hypothetical protein